ncbi:hypothetical protein C8R43DRAFT_1106444 [Mycena crocata]|nr:hypothetical protein C8R43DRAFT_1106444 [Mycena crocata]
MSTEHLSHPPFTIIVFITRLLIPKVPNIDGSHLGMIEEHNIGLISNHIPSDLSGVLKSLSVDTSAEANLTNIDPYWNNGNAGNWQTQDLPKTLNSTVNIMFPPPGDSTTNDDSSSSGGAWRPTIHGGVGGDGGKGGEKGGTGGTGQGAQLQPANAHLVRAIHGGRGGKGGDIDHSCHGRGFGGDGGTGERGRILEPFYLPPDIAVTTENNLLLSEFCDKYRVSKALSDLLTDAGFETAGALFGTTEEAFAACGLRRGQIEEVRRALGEWKNGSGKKGTTQEE